MVKIELNQSEQIDQLITESHLQPVAIFKHSTKCGISRFVLKDFESEIRIMDSSAFKYYYLDLIRYRSISDELAERFSIRHESPQLLVIKEGKIIHHSSHSEIRAGSIL